MSVREVEGGGEGEGGMERRVGRLDRKAFLYEGKGSNQEMRWQRKLSESPGHEAMIQ